MLHFHDITALSLVTTHDTALLLCYNSTDGVSRVSEVSFRYLWQLHTFAAAANGFFRTATPDRTLLPLLHQFDHHEAAVRGGADVEVGHVRSMLALYRTAAADVAVSVPLGTGRFSRTCTGTWATGGRQREVVVKVLAAPATPMTAAELAEVQLAFWQEVCTLLLCDRVSYVVCRVSCVCVCVVCVVCVSVCTYVYVYVCLCVCVCRVCTYVCVVCTLSFLHNALQANLPHVHAAPPHLIAHRPFALQTCSTRSCSSCWRLWTARASPRLFSTRQCLAPSPPLCATSTGPWR